jgi:hypothetical protein
VPETSISLREVESEGGIDREREEEEERKVTAWLAECVVRIPNENVCEFD